MTLVIMAAGIGSRFGGLKQIESIGPSGEFIIDYSVYDAIKNGFDKVIFIIKRENEELFKETIGKRIEGNIKVSYVYQDYDNLPVSLKIDRVKPWGTAQAIYCCKDIIKENFAVINSDDFYGEDCYTALSKCLKEIKDNEFGIVGYHVINTIPKEGIVKRGIIEEKNNLITNITESSIEQVHDKIIASPLSGEKSFEISDNTYVSMNALAFTPKIFDYLPNEFENFIKEIKDITKDEFLIPEVLKNLINENIIKVNLLNTTAVWHGMTYKEDKKEVVDAINELILEKIYPNKLWH